MISEQLERRILVTGFTLMFLGLTGFVISQLFRWTMQLFGAEVLLSITPSLLSDAGFLFALVISAGALLFIIEFILHRLGLAHDPVEIMKKK